ncbi:hypothetical protein ACTXG6_34220 [Pseudonocardia sp. Cha107L01]|uniref:hypothetical protein n=1 Tax=Pseudonocardia sp. Cha107L01 TaxID=3457576 RepID=UPI00403E5F76
MSGTRKPRARSQTPDPRRWSPCARCGECYAPVARWREGPICAYCYNAARRQEGRCADCGHVGMVPGLNTHGEPTCLRCGGIPLNLTCEHCGIEAALARGATCWRCLLTEMVEELLTGPGGTVSAKLQPVAHAITSMPRANSGVTWLRGNPRVGELLRALGSGEIALTHAALDELPQSRSVEYIRGLLVENEALPPRDRRLATFQRWFDAKLNTIANPDRRQVLERFGRWHHLRNLRRQATAGPVAAGPVLRAKQSVTVSIEFLGWLDARGQTLASCTQHDIDTWYATGPGTREHVERFLYWCRTQRLTTKLDVPQRDKDNPELIGESERLQIIRALLLHDTLPLPYRIAGCLITLYGQSASRVVRLGINDVDADSGEVQLRLGREWLPVPEPLSTLLATHLSKRSNTNTAANATTSWLFPGRMPNQPIHPQRLLDVLRDAGIPVRAARNTTWQQLVREAPPQVLANALGVSPTTAMQHADRAGSDWTRYAATIQASPKDP